MEKKLKVFLQYKLLKSMLDLAWNVQCVKKITVLEKTCDSFHAITCFTMIA